MKLCSRRVGPCGKSQLACLESGMTFHGEGKRNNGARLCWPVSNTGCSARRLRVAPVRNEGGLGHSGGNDGDRSWQPGETSKRSN